MSVKSIQLFIVTSIFLTLVFTGCQKSDTFWVDTKEIVLSQQTKDITFNLRTDNNKEWRIESNMNYPETEEDVLYKNWFKVSPNGGTVSLRITVSLIDEAIPEKDKTGAMVVRKGDKEILIPVRFKK